jgi:hypothetical protein
VLLLEFGGFGRREEQMVTARREDDASLPQGVFDIFGENVANRLLKTRLRVKHAPSVNDLQKLQAR